jgi:hypothetical protein
VPLFEASKPGKNPLESQVKMIDEPRREIIRHTKELAGLARQWAAIKKSKATIPHAKVLR